MRGDWMSGEVDWWVDGKVGIHRDVTLDRRRNRILDAGGNFSWDYYAVSDEEDTEAGKVASLIGLAINIRSEVDLKVEENNWKKGGDAGNVWNSGGADGVSSKNFDILSWRVLLWLTVIEMKMIGKVFELKEGLTWIRKMEVVIWLMMIAISMIMITMMVIVVIIHLAMFQ